MKIKRKSFVTVAVGVGVSLVMALAGTSAAIATTSTATPAKGATAAKHKTKKHKTKKHKKKTSGKTKKVAAKNAIGVGPTEKGSTKAIESGSEIPLAPKWTEAQLNAEPSGNWITEDGGTTGDHYSQLKEITTSNVAGLKADWMTQLDGSAEAPKYSGEAAPIEYKGVIYEVTGADDVFALSATSGKILWVHKGELPENVSDVCCGWDNRGLTMGGGLIYSALLTGSVEALNQKTGELVWKAELGEPSEGFTVTSSPLYYNGMIFIGPVGSEYNVRGFVEAFSAKTGELIWKHYNIPAPGEPGANTWPHNTSCTQCNDEWENGGATVWNAPTVDDKTGDIYYSTANAGGDLQGGTRAGDDLYTVSILALNYKTGKMAWGYQMVHHDIWDLDASDTTSLINVKVGGKKVEGVADADKDGFTYFINAKTGKPVFPIEEKAVPTGNAAVQATSAPSPTQPIPTMPPYEPETITAEQLAEIQASVNATATKRNEPAPTVVNNGGYEGEDVFAPWGLVGEPTMPVSSIGGPGLVTSGYDPANSEYFVCSRVSLNSVELTPETEAPKQAENFGYGRAAYFGGYQKLHGFLTAYDMQTGKIAWTDELPNSCYSGTLSTAGGVLFVPNHEGEDVAYEAATGKALWNFGLGGGSTYSTAFEFEGKERIAVYAGGNSLGDEEHADNLWLFSLNGTGPGPIEDGKTPPPPEKL